MKQRIFSVGKCFRCMRHAELSHSPKAVCINRAACDEQIRKNAFEINHQLRRVYNHQVKLIGDCIVIFRGFTSQHHVFAKKKCICSPRSVNPEWKDKDGNPIPPPPCDCIGWELVSSIDEATIFTPESASEWSQKFGGVAIQKPKLPAKFMRGKNHG
jgi:hypothetical protein